HALDRDKAAVLLHDVFRPRQAEAGPMDVARGGGTIEARKEVREFVTRDADATVTHRDSDVLRPRLHFHMYCGGPRAILDRVGDDVLYHTLQAGAVALQAQPLLWHRHGDGGGTHGAGHDHSLSGAAHQCLHVHDADLQAQLLPHLEVRRISDLLDHGG